jgi:hypothetical protein
MANKLYPKFKAQLMIGALDLRAQVVKALLLDGTSDYVYSDSHEFLSDVAAGARVKKTNVLTGKTVNLTTGAFDSDDPTAEAVTGEDISRVLLYIEGASDAASRLIMFQDTGVTTVPFTPDGSDIRIVVGTGGWFIL